MKIGAVEGLTTGETLEIFAGLANDVDTLDAVDIAGEIRDIEHIVKALLLYLLRAFCARVLIIAPLALEGQGDCE